MFEDVPSRMYDPVGRRVGPVERESASVSVGSDEALDVSFEWSWSN